MLDKYELLLIFTFNTWKMKPAIQNVRPFLQSRSLTLMDCDVFIYNKWLRRDMGDFLGWGGFSPDLFLVGSDTLFHSISQIISYTNTALYRLQSVFISLKDDSSFAGRLTAVCPCIIISFTEPVCCRSLWQTSIKWFWKRLVSAVRPPAAGVPHMNQSDIGKIQRGDTFKDDPRSENIFWLWNSIKKNLGTVLLCASHGLDSV